MKKMLALLLFGVMVTLAALAQPHEEKARQKFEKMSEELKLTDDQKVKIQGINEHFGTQIKALKQTNEDHDAEIKRLRGERQSQIKEVLTKEQIEKLEAIKKDRKQKGAEMRKEIRQYRKEVMLPVLKTHRMEFDKLLTDEERKVITDLQNRRKMLIRETGEMQKRGKETHEMDGKTQLRKEFTNKRKAAFRSDCNVQLKPIIEAHKADFIKIEGDLEPQIKEWEAHIKSIKEKHRGENFEEVSGVKDEKKIQWIEQQKRMNFLLLDPIHPEQDEE